MHSADPEILQSTSTALQVQLHEERIQTFPTYEALHQSITERLVYMLLHEMEPLLQLLYRIDVNEKKVKACFDQSDPKKIAPKLAELMIEREMQKQITRKQYKS